MAIDGTVQYDRTSIAGTINSTDLDKSSILIGSSTNGLGIDNSEIMTKGGELKLKSVTTINVLSDLDVTKHSIIE